ncbi:malonyl-coenzyme A:anthocyanin 3-O-glucoside-6''-O-malonyltransferase-like [Bidens hawaiensis]|uniref:malonyl-coenzyme A:anthocyanin 3-O-glucoside-6''-O-malonyltransferase-like n=1 Tax=Bidens hawaiensis TaxID=980011 RepID=UPI0040491989
MSSTTILEKCRISPPRNTVGERSLPLTCFDLPWLMFHAAVHQLFFYNFPYSKPHFIDKVIPKLKHSLSITLQHFFPFAGNMIVFPTDNHLDIQPRKPEIRYVDGDSVALIFAECDMDFDDLKGNHSRNCNKFYPLVPLLENAFKVSDFVKIPIFAVQVTLFPNSGFAIGISNHHSLCDARTSYDFLMGWASIAKHNTYEFFLASDQSLPLYDRVIKYPNSLDKVLLNFPPIRTLDENYKVPQLVPQTDLYRATIIMTRSQIKSLKKWLLVKRPTLEYVSSFAVTCGYIWSCVAKSRIIIEGTKGVYEVEAFACMADWRARLDPPVSQTYFGNCVGVCIATTKTTLLLGSDGFATAVELLGTAILEAVNNKQGFFQDMEASFEKGLAEVPTIGVAGTPKLNVYDIDFGWGRPEKYETISIDFNRSISVNASNESSEDLEVGLCLSAKQMEAFTTIYRNELESMLSDEF